MNSNEERSVGRRFSAAADSYEVLAAVQDRAAVELLHFLPKDLEPAHILEVGCGTGLLTRRLLKLFPHSAIDAVDISERMIARAQEACAQPSRVRWFVADTAQFTSSLTYPLIVSNCSLHWLTHLSAGLEHLANMLALNGHLVFSIMLRGTLAELRESRKKAAPHKPPLRELPEAEEVCRTISEIGLELVASDTQEYKVSYRSASAFLRAIHDQGVTGGTLSHSKALLTRRELENLIMEYEWHYHDAAGMVYATYRTLFVHAFKGVRT